MFFVTILWGESPDKDDEPVRYEFNTASERRAFLLGVSEAMGWAGWEVVDQNAVST